MALPRCWEIRDCGREKGGSKVEELGECIASREGLGHFCWAIAGTLCGKEVEGTTARQIEGCLQCEVYILRHGYSDEEYARISDSDVGNLAELLLENSGEYARICPALKADGPLAVGTVVGRDIWKRIV